MFGLFAIFLISLVGADVLVTYNQNQLDELDVDAISYVTLGCHIVHMEFCPHDICYFAGNLYTFYNCIDFQAEQINETDFIYYFHNDSIFHTLIDYDWMYDIYNKTNYTFAEQVYWQEAGRQGLEQVELIKDNIRSYQTQEQVWIGWNGTLSE
jgi:hypothetical protein